MSGGGEAFGGAGSKVVVGAVEPQYGWYTGGDAGGGGENGWRVRVGEDTDG